MLSPQTASSLNRSPNNPVGGTGHQIAITPVMGKPKSPEIYDRRLLLVLTLVEDNFSRQMAISDLAAAVNLSPGRLAHLFKSAIGVSPQRYLNKLRLEKARQSLEGSVLTVKEIAREVGMTSVSQFCRAFRVQFGETPGQYRKTHLCLDAKSLSGSFRSVPA